MAGGCRIDGLERTGLTGGFESEWGAFLTGIRNVCVMSAMLKRCQMAYRCAGMACRHADE